MQPGKPSSNLGASGTGSASGSRPGDRRSSPSRPAAIGSSQAPKTPPRSQKGPSLLSPFKYPAKSSDLPLEMDETTDKDAPLAMRMRHLNAEKYFLANSSTYEQYRVPKETQDRPGFNNSGKACNVELNSYQVISQPTKVVYQYDVQIGNGDEKRGLIMAVWECRTMQGLLGPQNHWIFDGNRIAWSMRSGCNINRMIDMDEEKGREPRGTNDHRVQMRQVAQVDLSALEKYLRGQYSFDNKVVEAINFIDHLMRVTPSKQLFAIKRSFFNKKHVEFQSLGAAVNATKGVYQSLRFGQSDTGAKLVVNVDVANTCLWHQGTIADCIIQLLTPVQIPRILQMVQPKSSIIESPAFLQLRKLNKVRFRVEYAKMSDRIRDKIFQVKRLTYTSARSHEFMAKDKKSGREYKTNVEQYFFDTYGYRLRWAEELPCVETMKGAIYPAELCHILPAQRYPFKLSESQTAQMIKFAVTRPPVRAGAIANGLKGLNWPQDPMLAKYGMKISTQMIKTNARLLNSPAVEFGQGRIETPKTDGRWRIDGKRFIEKNVEPLKRWGVIVFNDWGRDKVQKEDIIKFMGEFVKQYRAYGGEVQNPTPVIATGTVTTTPDDIEKFYNTIINQGGVKDKPQLMIVCVSAKVAQWYNRVKRNLDCRFGLVSQVMQNAHIKRCSLQYIGNVLMKVNAKLGGFSFRALPVGAKPGTLFTHFKKPTMIMGADVSHPGPGSLGASMAAISVSMDRFGGRYLATCQSNGHRVEMITAWNLDDMLKPMFREWMRRVSKGRMPEHMIIIRDGVSDGQFEHVLQQEVRDIKHVWQTLDDSPSKLIWKSIKFTVLVASKRHHIRFFPAKGHGDRNSNPFPGTLVERDVTHPSKWDFYLCSHTAIQGTARPVHYTVLLDEAKMAPAELINMIYEQCYSYVRSSTPVSIHPAVYYAHLAAKRAVAHERNTDIHTGGKPHHGGEQNLAAILRNAQIQADMTGKILSSAAKQQLREMMEQEYPCLVEMNNHLDIRTSMWFV